MSLLRHGPTALRIALVAAVASSALVLPAAGAAAVSTAYDALEAPLVRQINGTRAARGLPTLRVATRLTTAATRHASSMGSGGYFRHDFRTPGRRLDCSPFE